METKTDEIVNETSTNKHLSPEDMKCIDDYVNGRVWSGVFRIRDVQTLSVPERKIINYEISHLIPFEGANPTDNWHYVDGKTLMIQEDLDQLFESVAAGIKTSRFLRIKTVQEPDQIAHTNGYTVSSGYFFAEKADDRFIYKDGKAYPSAIIVRHDGKAKEEFKAGLNDICEQLVSLIGTSHRDVDSLDLTNMKQRTASVWADRLVPLVSHACNSLQYGPYCAEQLLDVGRDGNRTHLGMIFYDLLLEDGSKFDKEKLKQFYQQKINEIE